MSKLRHWWLIRAAELRLKRVLNSNLLKRINLAKGSQGDIEILAKLALDKSPQVRQVVAENPFINQDLIGLLSSDENAIVRAKIASRGDLSDEIIDKLVMDDSENVLVAICLREHLSKKQQVVLAEKSIGIRQKLAKRKDLDESISILLSQDHDVRVRILLAGATTCPEVLDKLGQDKSIEIQKVIAKRIGTFNPSDEKWKSHEKRFFKINKRKN